MKAKFLSGLIVTVLVSQATHAKNEGTFANMVKNEYYDFHNYDYDFNWNKIFKAIDQNKINVARFRFDVEGNPKSLLEFAMHNSINCDKGRDDNPDVIESLKAVKILLEKYLTFKNGSFDGNDSDKLFGIAMPNSIYCYTNCNSYCHTNWDLVELLLKHGAKPNQKNIKDIKKEFYYIYRDNKEKRQQEYPHILSLINQK